MPGSDQVYSSRLEQHLSEFRKAAHVQGLRKYAKDVSIDGCELIVESIKELHLSVKDVAHSQFFPEQFGLPFPNRNDENVALIKVRGLPRGERHGYSYADLEVI